MTFDLYLKVDHELYEPFEAHCASNRMHKCQVIYQKAYTPVIYELSPPVVYYQSITSLWFNPKATTNLIRDLPSDEMSFLNAKVGGTLIDYEERVDFDDNYGNWHWNYVIGQVGDVMPNTSYPLSMMWEVGKAGIQEQMATKCSYDNQTCYMSKAVPVIFSQSSNVGFTTGGQSLTVKGWGFNTPNITATVDGQNCTVTSYQKDQFTCDVPPKANISTVDVPHIGAGGMRRTLVNSSQSTNNNFVWFHNIESTSDSAWTRTESLSMEFMTPNNEGSRLANILKGWFKAPATARYRFYMACDDICKLFLDHESGSSSNKTQILRVVRGSSHKDYWSRQDGETRISDWVNMTAGQHYYIEGHQAEALHGDHLSVAVEIEQTEMVGHMQAMREVQRF